MFWPRTWALICVCHLEPAPHDAPGEDGSALSPSLDELDAGPARLEEQAVPDAAGVAANHSRQVERWLCPVVEVGNLKATGGDR